MSIKTISLDLTRHISTFLSVRDAITMEIALKEHYYTKNEYLIRLKYQPYYLKQGKHYIVSTYKNNRFEIIVSVQNIVFKCYDRTSNNTKIAAKKMMSMVQYDPIIGSI